MDWTTALLLLTSAGFFGFVGKEVWNALKAGPGWFVARREKHLMKTAEGRRTFLQEFEALKDELKAEALGLRTRCADVEARVAQLAESEERLLTLSTALESVLLQVERNYRQILDEMGVAYWEVDKNGKFIAANFSFYDLTGIDTLPENGIGDIEWLAAVCEKDRAGVTRKWRAFCGNNEIYTEMTCTFEHLKSKKQSKVTIKCKTVFGGGSSVYRYTARTKEKAPRSGQAQ